MYVKNVCAKLSTKEWHTFSRQEHNLMLDLVCFCIETKESMTNMPVRNHNV